MNLLKILLAEDDPMNQLLIRKVVGDAGFKLDVVENGQIAIDKLQEQDYDLILMDVEMPVMNGYEATSYIREHLGLKSNIPIIMVTNVNGSYEAAKCMLLGANTYLSKPFKSEQLLEEIATLVI
ncbi:MAG: hypothetical protein COW65_06680 [Cytophagales bacterium CG18_big_fil_WC_8_21_14_2_50_42_9]|nr:MAG: hypothetical protein COW65_06680 [Cytophagales bacterium CG18_big_fil_WC_8_21_14_2_50_42_9]